VSFDAGFNKLMNASHVLLTQVLQEHGLVILKHTRKLLLLLLLMSFIWRKFERNAAVCCHVEAF